MTGRVSVLDAFPGVVGPVLVDHTTGGSVMYATDDYESVDASFTPEALMTEDVLVGAHRGMIRPRLEKNRDEQVKRTRVKAEVFTPSWVCDLMNNVADDNWFGRGNVFNTLDDEKHTWVASKGRIEFPEGKAWEDYVAENRMEITCGEAPYLVSRYDTTTGEEISVPNRIGLLDRKLRIVGENTDNEADWVKWALEAYKHTYGFEFQGDNLVLARINMLETYRDYMMERWGRDATEDEIMEIANVVSWNIWQMDGLTGTPPFQGEPKASRGVSLFGALAPEDTGGTPCRIMDWDEGKAITFLSLKEH